MKSSSGPVPCRLFVMLATEAPTGVILRRGPSKWVQVIRWDTETDAFEPGQWFHGRIHEDRSDVSPDGTKLLYMATKYSSRDESVGQIWTAVSKVPYLTALTLFAHKDSGTWQGGGMFVSNDEVWIDAEPAPGTNTFFPHKDHPATGLKVTAHPSAQSTLTLRLKRQGWKNGEKAHLFKPLSLSIRPITKMPGGKMSGGQSFVLRDFKRGTVTPLDGVVWADWDRRGRLVYAQDGKLFTGEVDEAGQLHSEEIADFNAHTPQPMKTPDWAREW